MTDWARDIPGWVHENTSLQRRLLFTLGAVAIYRLGLHVPLPGVNHEVLETSRASVFSLGVGPYIQASVVVLLLSGFIPYFRRLRDGPPDANLGFDRWIYGVTVPVTLIQGWSLALYLEALQGSAGPSASLILANPGFAFRIQILLAVTAGVMLLTWLADQITERGVANGIAVIVLADLVASVTSGVTAAAAAVRQGDQSLGQAILLLLIAAGVVAGAVVVTAAKRTLPLQHLDPPAPTAIEDSWTPSIALRVNTVGTIPANVATAILTAVLLAPALAPVFSNRIIQFVLIVVFTYLVTAITFNSADVVERVNRYRFTVADPDSTEVTAGHLDRIVERLVFPYALFLAGLTVVPALADEVLDMKGRLSYLVGPQLLVLVAIGLAILEALRTEREKRSRDDDDDRSGGWTPIFTGETDLEVDLVRGILARSGIPSVRHSTRAMSIAGTLALWEASRPTFPSLTLHRRLGSGHVCAQVPQERVEDARRALTAYDVLA
jgi:preprotein translocase subunit SecY